MNDVVQLATELTARAQREEAAAFDRQYQLARRAEQALAALTAAGENRARQWADDDRRDDADRRFDPEPDDVERAAPVAPRPGPMPTLSGGGVRGARGASKHDEDDDEEDEPTTWL